MKFNKIIMNPPYLGNIHLQILNKCIEHFDDELVNLSPILWAQFPSIDRKYLLEPIIESLEVINRNKVRKLFNTRNQTDLAIYHLKKDNKYKSITDYNSFFLRGFENYKLIESIWNKVQLKKPDIIKSFISSRSKPLEKYSIIFSHMSGLNKNHNFVYINGIGENGKIYKENVKNQHKNDTSHHLEFDTYNEANNFRLSLYTKFMRFIIIVGQPGLLYDLKTIPYMKDYTRPWTDKDFYDYFEITTEEQTIIEDVLSLEIER